MCKEASKWLMGYAVKMYKLKETFPTAQQSNNPALINFPIFE